MEFAKKYKAAEVEKKWQDKWKETNIYGFDPDRKGECYSVDTPPPTVSGNLHIGHVFSYTQAEIIIRHRRMKGMNIFYPFGFDDNGLPTERYVEKTHKVRAADMKRDDFVSLCLKTTQDIEDKFKDLWSSLGFSCDWNQDYSTIDNRCRRISQRSFIDLYKKGHIYQKEGAGMWCGECRTAIAQAELENVDKDSLFSDIPFELKDGGQVVISTTRPELLPACTAIFIHPEDSKNAHLAGKTAIVPLFGHEVPVLTDEKADPEKGTGCVMCCTFGDRTDIEWWEKHGLQARIVVGANGRMNDLAGQFSGMKPKVARKAVLEALQEKNLVLASREITHPVNTHERCGTDVEYLVTNQWYIRLLDIKDQLIALADKINWYPSYMKTRYVHWVENLAWDWCISRQRYYGVPFPLWQCGSCGEIRLAEDDKLPIDPVFTSPEGPCTCGAEDWIGEKDIMDTWATSSVTPQVNQRWGEPDSRENLLRPMSLRPQAHDIIRTWAFYTIVKAWLHHEDIPWNDVVVSGHVLFKKGQKISKSKGAGGPDAMISQNGADAIRYWTAQAKLGTDCYLEEKEFKIARRLLTKMWNASKFAAPNLGNPSDDFRPSRAIDQAMINQFNRTASRADAYLGNYEFSLALGEIESFFWKDLCDNYLEIVKERLYTPENFPEDAVESAKNTLGVIFNGVLRLFAPYIPHITEELHAILFVPEGEFDSIHTKEYPTGAPEDKEISKIWNWSLDLIGAVRKYKTSSQLSHGTYLKKAVFQKPDFPVTEELITDLKGVLRVETLEITSEFGDLNTSEFGNVTVGIEV